MLNKAFPLLAALLAAFFLLPAQAEGLHTVEKSGYTPWEN